MGPAESKLDSSRSGLGRALGALFLLAAEYLALAMSFDGTPLTGAQSWWAAFGQVGALVSISVAVFTAGLLVRGRELFLRMREATADLSPLEPRWAVAHGLCFAGFVAVTNRVFGGDRAPSAWMGLTLAAWLAAGGATFATLFRLAFGSAWRPVARVVARLFAAGFVLGLFAWLAGVRSVPLWPWLAGATLHTSSFMLAPFVDSVRVVPQELLLGVNDFDVTVAAACSGLESLGAVSVFLLGYLYTFREQLRFPQSLWLVPAALFAVWIANALRIAILVAIGAYWSPDLALGGFHSKAGWLALCLVALGVVVATRNSPRFARAAPVARFTDSATAAYLLPLLTLVGIGLVTELFTTHVDWLYPLRIVAAAAVAWHYRREYPPPVRRFPGFGLATGVIAFALWLALADKHPAALAEHERDLASASAWLRATWLGFRVIGAVAVVPVIEELAFRGFLQRRLIGEDFAAVPQGKFTVLSLGVSALAFGLLHESWLAGALAGVAYSIACYRRGRLEDAVVAHATTNALLVLGSLVFGYRELWH
jgi:exosortase E/protease (VPEID-CTERM system)